jgi:pseudomonalisin
MTEEGKMFKRAIIAGAALVSLFLAPGSQAWARGPLVVDDNDRVALPRSVHPLARAEFDRGASSAALPMERMIMSLRIPADRQARLDQLLHEQQDPASANYQRWLTPEEFGSQFGPDPEDIAAVETWLTSHGFTVAERAKGGTWINFSGTTAQVKRAFRTEIHDYQVNGHLRHANATAPEIPRGLAATVSGVVTLHNFPRKSMLKKGPVPPAAGPLPAYTSGTGTHTLAPGDFAAIYNVAPLYAAGIDGSGQAIAIVGRTHPAASNWSGFRSSFGLPANPPVVIVNGTDPGDTGADEDGEADLDVEWSGAVAKGATIKFVVSKSTFSTDGVDLSAQYIVNQNLAAVMSTSFGSCESQMGASENAFFNNLWQQAAAQGITSLVSTGDNGAAGCDDPNATTGTLAAVNGLASTPYNVAVGGTQFNDGVGSFWNPTNFADGSSALGYIPETAWNESANQSGGSGLWSTGGGASSIYAKPIWQAVAGVPGDGKRDIPDLSLSAASHDGYRVMTQGSWASFGGTSASSPSLAGLMALVVQKTGVRQGNANTRLYQLAAAQYAFSGAAVFHDITAGSNGVPGVGGNFCAPAYDLATGLGSVDANLLVTAWAVPTTADFYLAPSRAQIVAPPGGAASTTLVASVSGGLSGNLVLSAAGLPAGASATFAPATLAAPGSSTLTLAVAAATPPGSYPITVTGSAAGVTHSTQLTLVVNAPFFDGFEGGNFSSWTSEAGSYARSVSSVNAAAGSFSYTQTGGDSLTPRNGLSHTLPGVTPSYISFYAKSSTTTGASAYFVIGDDLVNTNRGIIFFAFNTGNLSVYDGINWRPGLPYTAGTWYFIEFRNIDWVAKTYDFYANGVLQLGGVAFRSQTTTSLTKVHLYNMDPAQAWYDDIYIGVPNAHPTVGVTVPASGATGVAVSLPVSATFSRAMDAGSFTGASFTLQDASGGPVSGAVSYDAASGSAVFTPSVPLSNGATYSATLSTGVRDLAGSPLAAAKSWSFSTALPRLSVAVTGSGSVNSTPAGIACTGGNSGLCSAQFGTGTTVTLLPTAGSGYQFAGWTGGCSGSGNCQVALTADTPVGASFVSSTLVRISGGAGYVSLQEAYDAAAAGATIQARDLEFAQNVTCSKGIAVHLEGGYNADFTSNSGFTTLNGVLTLRGGSLTVKGVAVK